MAVRERVRMAPSVFRLPVEKLRDGRYLVPEAPGYSIEMFPESLEDYAFPQGSSWRGR